jgi:hypothetical protein
MKQLKTTMAARALIITSSFVLLIVCQTFAKFNLANYSILPVVPGRLIADTCSPVSTLSCSSIKVVLPFSLSFNAPIEGTLADKNAAGTGFTTVNAISGTRLSADGAATVPAVNGYEPSKITLTGGQLQLLANKGIDYLTNNNQINILGVQINSVKKLQIDAKVIKPLNGTQSQQAGIWYGLNDKTFIKLTISGNKVELRKEFNDVSSTLANNSNPDQRTTAVVSGLNNQTVSLRMVVDSIKNTVQGYYSTDGVNFIDAGASYPTASIAITGTGLTVGNAYAGIYATYRNGTAPVTYSFDDFSLSSLVVNEPVSQATNINFQPSTANVPTGYLTDTGLPFDAGRKYGWIDPNTKQPIDLQANMRLRSGTGDQRQLTLVQMQATTNGQRTGTWEYALANGLYRVTLSAGDSGFYDSNNQVNVEGLPAIADFAHTATAKYKTVTAVVQVTDGRLTVDANGGVNSKLNYITVEPASAVADNTAPVASARLVGTLKSANAYDDQVQIYMTATDAGGSGLASLQYSINGSTFIDYKVPFVLNAGNYNVIVKATDGNGNQFSTTAYTFSVIAQTSSGAYMVLQNLDNFPSNTRLVASLIQTPWRRTKPDTTPYNANHDVLRLRINNKGTGKLNITALRLSNSTAWKIASVNGDTTAKLPVSIASKASTDISIKFIAKNAASRLKVFADSLIITSNDSVGPVKAVVLSGIWQGLGEDINEPYAQQVINAFGYSSIIGYAHDDGNVDGTTRVPNSSEENANYFIRANASLPVKVVQLAAYHGCCAAVESIRFFTKGSSSSSNIFTHNPLDGQSILPRLIGSSVNLAQGTFNPTGVFGFMVGSSSSDRTQNFNGLIGIRVVKALDGQGNVIPNAYFLNCDYLGTAYTNFDYQDNIYYVENIRPETGTVHYSELVSLTKTAVTFDATLTGSNGTTTLTLKNNGTSYADGTSDPAITLKSVQITGPNASEFSIGAFSLSSLPIQGTRNINVTFTPSTVGIKNAVLLINYNSALTPLRIPLYGIGNSTNATVNVVKRIKGAADADVTIGNLLYEKDVNYRKGSIKLDKQVALNAISATDIDSLYQTYLSAAADLAETRYEIPVANDNYLVRMHFVENYFNTTGSRVFGINIENNVVLNNFDIYNEVKSYSALVKDFAATVSDGVLTIKFNPTANRLALAAVELFNVKNVQPATPQARSVFEVASNDLSATERKLTVYPNPSVGNSFNLTLANFAKNEIGRVLITNSWGRRIKTEKIITDINGGVNIQVSFNNTLPKGVYMINVQLPSGEMYSKLLVQ